MSEPSSSAPVSASAAGEAVLTRPRRSAWRALWAALALGLAKFKSLFALVKLLPAGKFLLTSVSMLGMIAVEAMRTGVWFAVGFVLLILIHELGHAQAMRRAGVQASWPVFIPFFGAMIAMKGTPRDRATEAAIAYGGPLAGAGASLLCAALGLGFASRAWLSLAYSGFFLNLFNLTPLSPLDGGRIAQAFSKRAWWLGLGILAALLLVTRAPQLLLIGLLALPRLLRRGEELERDVLEASLQRSWALRYFGLCAFLALGVGLCARLLG